MVDLTNCDREPIHIPGSIQPHGVLLALDQSFRITQHSANAATLLNANGDNLLSRTLGDLFAPASTELLLTRLQSTSLNLHPLYPTTILTIDGTIHLDAIAHRIGDVFVLEMEPSRHTNSVSADSIYQLLQTALTMCRTTAGIIDLGQCIADQIRRLNGFDRVMVYQFDEEWNGRVIAERKCESLEPFLGLHYPASDIPVQARELYTKNWLRFITDRDYVPSPIVPAISPATGEPLDMSFCVLRSVSPIHLEYLRNMGVGASMSISLLQDGKLWGLVACHHYSPRFVPYEIRTACEHLGQMLSLRLSANVRSEAAEGIQYRAEKVLAVADSFRPMQVAESLLNRSEELLELVEAGGAAIVDGQSIVRIGQTPGAEDIDLIIRHLPAPGESETTQTDRIHDWIGTSRLNPVAAGVLAISLNRFGRRMILFFRPEAIQTVHWAGDPAKSVVKGDDGVRLSPRGSFALWKQTVQGKSVSWSTVDRITARDLRRELAARLVSYAEELSHQNVTLQRATLEQEAQLASEREARSLAERLNKMKDDFVATLSHELRTPLNAIIGWAHLLGRSAKITDDDRNAVIVIDRNARAQAQMIEDLLDMSRITAGKLRLDVQPVHFPPIVDAAISTVKIAADAKQITFSTILDPMVGLTVSGDPQRLQQVVWNLLSNAVKFTPKLGKIRLQLQRVDSHVELIISDSGIGIAQEFLPHVFDRFRQADATSSRSYSGLGLGLSIVRHLTELHGGTVVASSEGIGKGSTFTVSLPVRAISKKQMPLEMADDDLLTVDLEGVKILVIDDEPDSRELLRRVLTDHKASVQTAGSAADAMDQLRGGSFDVMISDIGMPGEDGYALIRRVREMESAHAKPKMPAIALTAYARAEDRRRIIMAGFQVHVAKPVEPSELLAVVASLANRV